MAEVTTLDELLGLEAGILVRIQRFPVDEVLLAIRDASDRILRWSPTTSRTRMATNEHACLFPKWRELMDRLGLPDGKRATGAGFPL